MRNHNYICICKLPFTYYRKNFCIIATYVSFDILMTVPKGEGRRSSDMQTTFLELFQSLQILNLPQTLRTRKNWGQRFPVWPLKSTGWLCRGHSAGNDSAAMFYLVTYAEKYREKGGRRATWKGEVLHPYHSFPVLGATGCPARTRPPNSGCRNPWPRQPSAPLGLGAWPDKGRGEKRKGGV